MANPRTRKSCIVPKCTSTTTKTPEKLFFQVPKDPKMRKKWFYAAKRADPVAANSCVYCCEDHFDVETDMENYIKYRLVGGNLKLKKGVVPHKFACQKNANKDVQRLVVEKRNKLKLVNKMLTEEYEDVEFSKTEITSGASEASSNGSTLLKKKRKLYIDSDDDDNDSDIEDIEDSEDEYAAWAKEWALELRQMDPDQQNFATRAITYILMEGRLGLLNKNSVLVNNKVPDEQPSQKELNVAPLGEFLVLDNRLPEATSAAVVSESSTDSEEIVAPSDSKSSLVDTGTSSITVSHKTAECSSRVKPKTTGKARVSRSVKFSHKIATSNSGSSFDNTESSFTVTTHVTPIPRVSSSSVVKTEPSESPRYSSADGSSSIFTKLEPLDSIESTSYEVQDPLFLAVERCSNTDPTLLSASHGSATAVRSPTLVKPELKSPPSSPEFAVVVKNEQE